MDPICAGAPVTVMVDGYGEAGLPSVVQTAAVARYELAVSLTFITAVEGVPTEPPVMTRSIVSVASCSVSPQRVTNTVLAVSPGLNVTTCPAIAMKSTPVVHDAPPVAVPLVAENVTEVVSEVSPVL